MPVSCSVPTKARPYSHSEPLESHKSELHADWRNLINAGPSTSSAGHARYPASFLALYKLEISL
jgi:hypothetical protein